jgi:hypothetical protein
MPWTADDQTRAEANHAELKTEFNQKLGEWQNAMSGGQINQGQAAVEETINRWRANAHRLQESSAALTGNDSVMDRISILATKLAEEKTILNKLRSESITRSDQAETTNPKIRGTPYTNILWLNRTFRSSTRLALLILSVIFSALALAVIVYIVIQSGIFNQSPQQQQSQTTSFGYLGARR